MRNWNHTKNISLNLHYQKIDKYKRKYRGNIFVGKFSRDFTDGNIPSVYTDEIIVSFLPTKLPMEFSVGKFPR